MLKEKGVNQDDKRLLFKQKSSEAYSTGKGEIFLDSKQLKSVLLQLSGNGDGCIQNPSFTQKVTTTQHRSKRKTSRRKRQRLKKNYNTECVVKRAQWNEQYRSNASIKAPELNLSKKGARVVTLHPRDIKDFFGKSSLIIGSSNCIKNEHEGIGNIQASLTEHAVPFESSSQQNTLQEEIHQLENIVSSSHKLLQKTHKARFKKKQLNAKKGVQYWTSLAPLPVKLAMHNLMKISRRCIFSTAWRAWRKYTETFRTSNTHACIQSKYFVEMIVMNGIERILFNVSVRYNTAAKIIQRAKRRNFSQNFRSKREMQIFMACRIEAGWRGFLGRIIARKRLKQKLRQSIEHVSSQGKMFRVASLGGISKGQRKIMINFVQLVMQADKPLKSLALQKEFRDALVAVAAVVESHTLFRTLKQQELLKKRNEKSLARANRESKELQRCWSRLDIKEKKQQALIASQQKKRELDEVARQKLYKKNSHGHKGLQNRLRKKGEKLHLSTEGKSLINPYHTRVDQRKIIYVEYFVASVFTISVALIMACQKKEAVRAYADTMFLRACANIQRNRMLNLFVTDVFHGAINRIQGRYIINAYVSYLIEGVFASLFDIKRVRLYVHGEESKDGLLLAPSLNGVIIPIEKWFSTLLNSVFQKTLRNQFATKFVDFVFSTCDCQMNSMDYLLAG